MWNEVKMVHIKDGQFGFMNRNHISWLKSHFLMD